MRLARACVLLEVIDDETGHTHAIGYELDRFSVASIDYEYGWTADWDGGTFCIGDLHQKPSKYHIVIDGAGREFRMDLGTWFDAPPQRELNPAHQQLPEETS